MRAIRSDPPHPSWHESSTQTNTKLRDLASSHLVWVIQREKKIKIKKKWGNWFVARMVWISLCVSSVFSTNRRGFLKNTVKIQTSCSHQVSNQYYSARQMTPSPGFQGIRVSVVFHKLTQGTWHYYCLSWLNQLQGVVLVANSARSAATALTPKHPSVGVRIHLKRKRTPSALMSTPLAYINYTIVPGKDLSVHQLIKMRMMYVSWPTERFSHSIGVKIDQNLRVSASIGWIASVCGRLMEGV